MTIKVEKYFTETELGEIKQTTKDILRANGVDLRDSAIKLYLNGEAEPSDHKGKITDHKHDLASRAWVAAVLIHLKVNGYEVKKK